MHDLLITDAHVVDGSGAPAYSADVAVRDGLIVDIGRLSGQRARQQVALHGLVLAPGFVDVHTHYDAQLTWDATASPSPALGVTSLVMGNCGFGIAPCPPDMREEVAANLAVVEGMDLGALRAGVDWDFETFAEYLALLRRKGSFANVAVLVGHSTVRTAVMGRAAAERAEPSDAELAAMRALVAEALQAGAIGFASSFSPNHLGDGGKPMPSTLASEAELRSLLGVLGEQRRGVFQMAIGTRVSVERMEDFAAETGRPMFITSTQAMYNAAMPTRAAEVLDSAAAAQARGHCVVPQVPCQPLSFDFTAANPYPFYSHGAFAPVRAGSAERLAAAYADAGFRARFRQDLSRPATGGIFFGDWSMVEVTVPAQARNAALEGRTIAALAAERGADPVDVFFDLALDEDLQTLFVGKFLNADEAGVGPLLQHPAGLVSLSDAGAHLAFLCDAGYGCHFLGHWVRERGLLALEEGVRRLTSRPAELYGIARRGRIARGWHADLLAFDAARIGVGAKTRVNDFPAGASRCMRSATGIAAVWVNGVQVVDGTAYTQPRQAPGQILDRFEHG